MKERSQMQIIHTFIDEAGDPNFFGKGRIPILGKEGVSSVFILGMLSFNNPLNDIRKKVIELQNQITNDPYFKSIPSIIKKKSKYGYFLHAKDDIPEVRKMAFDLINSIDCKFECVVARKNYEIFENKHNSKDSEFYADLLSHLLKDKVKFSDNLVLNIAERSQCTTHQNLTIGLNKAIFRGNLNIADSKKDFNIAFNVQNPTNEPLLNLTDYFCWAIQRFFEKGETRYYDYLEEKISWVLDLYDFEKSKNGGNFYNKLNKLVNGNKKSP